jgi:hypothetical protein
MHRAGSFACHVLHLALLRSASLLVPAPQRAEWLQEWSNELWHVRRACLPIGAFSWQAQGELTAFCFGSFPDAACLRRHSWQRKSHSAAIHGSAWQCVLSLSVALVLCAIVSELLPGVRSEQLATRARLNPGVVLIGPSPVGATTATVSVERYRDWKAHGQPFFLGMAFYHPEREALELPGMPRAHWTVAHASADLFGMMGAPILDTDAAALPDPHLPQAILSQSAWRAWFHSDPEIVGAVIPVGHHKVQIAGVISPGTWRAPANPDLWVLESDTTLASAGRAGYIIARLTSASMAEMYNRSISITTFSPDGRELILRGEDMEAPASGSLPIFAFALFLAILALPAVTSVSSSESQFATHRPSLRSRVNRWTLLASKLTLIAGIAYFAALDIAYALFADFSPSAEFLQFAATFCICLFGLRWALVDQSHRCPVCLRHVTHPAQVGIASWNFLGWNGTEMICMGGHALLHVPSLPTSWFSGQRGMYLDTSWDFLFADPTLHP